jgi:hypothetical protein
MGFAVSGMRQSIRGSGVEGAGWRFSELLGGIWHL